MTAFIVLVILIVSFRPIENKRENKEIDYSENLAKKYTTNSPKIGNSTKNIIVIFEDLKCSHCRLLHNNIIRKLDLERNDIEIRYVNMAFLGKDSVKGSRAVHAVNLYAPKNFREFHNALFDIHPKKEDNLWFTEKRIDTEIDKLPISKKSKEKIKNAYKEEGNKVWESAEKDKEVSENLNVSSTPTVYVNGHLIKKTSQTLEEFKRNISMYLNGNSLNK
ncbi:hypothetical protein CYJ00_010140 [Staphylococcus pseudintermedius]|nr:hypothetical protein CYJ00_010140 [Staphylococcus pseudintermedius]